MATTRRSSRSRFVLLLLVLTAGTIMTLDYRGQASGILGGAKNAARDAFAPLEHAVTAVFRPVGDFFQGAVDYSALKSENARLRNQVGELRRRTLEQADQARELQQLTRLDNLPFAGSIPKVTAQVVYSSFSNFQLTLELDRGRSAGIAKGMTVVAGEGLVGRIVQASDSRATVLMVTDPASSVGIRAATAGVVGVATGQGTGQPLRVDYVAPGTVLHKGDVFVTSGAQGSAFPPGIPVGTVSSVSQRPDALQEDVSLNPVVDLSRLEYVNVLKWNPSP